MKKWTKKERIQFSSLRDLKHLSSARIEDGALWIVLRSKTNEGKQSSSQYNVFYELYPAEKMAKKYKQKNIDCSGCGQALWSFMFKPTTAKRDIAKIKKLHAEHSKHIVKTEKYIKQGGF